MEKVHPQCALNLRGDYKVDETVIKMLDELRKKLEDGAISFGTYWNECQNIISNYKASQPYFANMVRLER